MHEFYIQNTEYSAISKIKIHSKSSIILKANIIIEILMLFQLKEWSSGDDYDIDF